MKQCKAYFRFFNMGIILWMLSPFLVYGQLIEPVTFQIDQDKLPAAVAAGEHFFVTIRADIDEQWYLYSMHNNPDDGPIPTMFSSEGSEMHISGDIKESQAELKYDPNFDTELGLHRGEAVFRVPARFRHNLIGEKEIKLKVHFQACDDKSCLPPRVVLLTAPIILTESSELAESVTENFDFGTGTLGSERRSQSIGEKNNGSVVYFFLFSAVFAVAALFALIRYRKKR
jgi:hypothetical protein